MLRATRLSKLLLWVIEAWSGNSSVARAAVRPVGLHARQAVVDEHRRPLAVVAQAHLPRTAPHPLRPNRLAGSLEFDVRDLTGMTAGGRQFDVICANLIYDLLIAEREKLTSWLAPGGQLILAGILIEQFPGVQKAFCELGMEMLESEALDEWRAGVVRYS